MNAGYLNAITRLCKDWMKPVPLLIGMLLIAAIAVILIYSDRAGSITLLLNDKSLTLDLPNGELHYVDVLKNLMREDTDEQREIRNDALAILARKYDVYLFGNQGLIDRIGREPADSAYAEKFVRLVKQKRGPFHGSRIFDLGEARAVDEIRRIKYDDPFVTALRQEILKGALDNLQPRSRPVTVKHSEIIPPGEAGVCVQSEFNSHKVRLFHPGIGKTVRVVGSFSREYRDCNESPNNWVEIGTADYETLGRTKEAVAKAEPANYNEVPSNRPKAKGSKR